MKVIVVALCGLAALSGCTSEPQYGADSPALKACRELEELVEPFDRTKEVPPYGLLPAEVEPDEWRDVGEEVLERAEIIRDDDRSVVAGYAEPWEAAGTYLVKATPESYDQRTFYELKYPADCSDLADSVE